ncbi:MAG: hypothetical protein EWM72_02940 [Nitrospira sp.]|nr:MAG: hypothetical protein EWM72_02940 [Nitrospira sp.]
MTRTPEGSQVAPTVQVRPHRHGAEFVPGDAGDSSAEDRKFELAVELSRALAEAKLGSGESLREALYLGRHISLWDVVTTVMVLYRFPLPFVPIENGTAWMRRLASRLRPYQGLAARFRDFVTSDRRRTDVGCAEWPEGPRTVVVTCFTKSFYHQVLQPVADSIARRHLAKVVVVHGGDLAGARDHAGPVIFHSLWNHWTAEVDQAQRNMQRSLRRLRRELLDRSQFNSLMDGVRSHVGDISVKGELQWLFWREFVRLAPQIAVAEHIVFRHRPALIISADDADQRCRIYSLLARAAGVPTLLVQQGLSFKDYPEWRFLSHDKVAAMGESSRADMKAQGVDPDRIVVTGHPGFDNLVSAEPDVRIRVRKELGIAENERIVLFASQPSYVGAFDQPSRRTEMIKGVVKVVGSLKDVKLVVKPHPGETRRELVTLIGNKQHVVLADGAASIAPLIKTCDVFVTFFSTTALQALYAGKPVITIDIPGSGGGRLYTDSQATWVARSAEELMAHITNLLSAQRAEHLKTKEEARCRFLQEMVHHPDGKATDWVVRLIAGLLGSETVS